MSTLMPDGTHKGCPYKNPSEHNDAHKNPPVKHVAAALVAAKNLDGQGDIYKYQLGDNFTQTEGRVFLTGTQALARLVLAQRRADLKQGLNTAGFVTGYRGSPLAGVDIAMWRTQTLLDASQITFLPAINEDLAATIVMGTQQAGTRDDRTVDGVFAMWYGKGPGVDRAGDALHHGNAAGASRCGGVLLIVGDDHTAASSSIPHASETSLLAFGIPIVHPASVEEYEYFGRWGWALSRYSGAWVAFKVSTETVESGRSFELQPVPDFALDQGITDHTHLEYSAKEFLTPAIENRMADRVQAVKAFSRQHRLDRLIDPAPLATLGLITSGKAHLDTLDALKILHDAHPDKPLPALRHYKIGLSWPIEEAGLRAFAQGLEHILIVEEKAPVIENQVKDLLFNELGRATVAGKLDLESEVLVPAAGQLRPALVAGALRRWLAQTAHIALPSPECQLAAMAAIEPGALTRRPYFCSGCPHNTSTKVPEGSQALAGVGCHYMATWMNRNTSGLTQMGGEGADWIGLSRYTRARHVFQNMGEGTYFHSGYLAIRQAISAGANITYKILFNDAVAMTGGQPVDGSISVPQICQQMLGEGAKRVVITTDEPEKYRDVVLATGVAVHHRRDLDRLQRELREVAGVTILIHDQVCAAEKRRRRKKKTFPDPARRLFINTAVCEGCGDCGTQSNCLSLTPVETPFGRKRAIDQSSCNKDYSCVDGFCPSFVSVLGGTPRKGTRGTPDRDPWKELGGDLPEPDFKTYRTTCNIIAAGIGGTGIVTVGAILSMATHLEGRAASILDITGLAQKGGAVVSHIRLSNTARSSGAVRIDAQQADVAIFCDAVAAVNPETLAALKPQHTQTVLNTYLAPTAEFTRDPDIDFNPEHLIQTIRAAAGTSTTHLLNAHDLATRLFGDSIMANMMMLGFAWQSGAIPVSAAAIDQALVLNGVAVQANQAAFKAGRMLAHQPQALAQLTRLQAQAVVVHFPESLAKIVDRCRADLTVYQNAAYAKHYTDVVDAVLAAEQHYKPDTKPVLAVKVAQALHKLMAYKDEYEVARLFTNGEFRRELSEKFEGDFTLQFHMAPPLLARRDPATGIPRKISLGQGTEKVLAVLARCKTLRGTWLDIFGYSAERKAERKLIHDYRQAILTATGKLGEGNFATLLALAELPQMVRGYGHIKMANIEQYQAKFKVLQERL